MTQESSTEWTDPYRHIVYTCESQQGHQHMLEWCMSKENDQLMSADTKAIYDGID